jgi:hypothetical protein
MFSHRIRHWLGLGLAVHLSAASLWAVPGNPETQPKPKANVGEGLSEDAELTRATGLYDTGQYAACVDAFDHLLSPDEPRRLHTPSKIENARTYHGACLIGVGRTTDAERVFREAILENPQMKAPDGLLFPEAVVELFLRVHESMLDEIRHAEQKRVQAAEARANREQLLRERERLRVEQLVAIAEKETIIERHSRWIAAIPYGVGQFQNDNAGRGWLFLLSETAMTGALAGSLYMQAWYQSQKNDPKASKKDLDARTRPTIVVQEISGYGLLGLALVGIIEAQISFVPEVRTERKRSLPEHLRLPAKKTLPPPAPLSLKFLPWATREVAGAAVVGVF